MGIFTENIMKFLYNGVAVLALMCGMAYSSEVQEAQDSKSPEVSAQQEEQKTETQAEQKTEAQVEQKSEEAKSIALPEHKLAEVVGFPAVLKELNPKVVFSSGSGMTPDGKRIMILVIPTEEILQSLESGDPAKLSQIVLNSSSSDPMIHDKLSRGVSSAKIQSGFAENFKNLMVVKTFDKNSWIQSKKEEVESASNNEKTESQNKFSDKALFVPVMISTSDFSVEIGFSEQNRQNLEEMGKIAKEFETVKEKIKAIDTSIEELKAPHKEKFDKKEEAQKKLPELESKVKELQEAFDSDPNLKEIPQQEKEISDKEASLKTKQDSLNSLNEKVKSVEGEYNSLKATFDKARGGAKNRAKAPMEAKKKELDDATADRDKVSKESNLLKTEIDSKKQAIEGLKEKSKTLSAPLEEAKSQLEATKEIISSVENDRELIKLQGRLEDLESKKAQQIESANKLIS